MRDLCLFSNLTTETTSKEPKKEKAVKKPHLKESLRMLNGSDIQVDAVPESASKSSSGSKFNTQDSDNLQFVLNDEQYASEEQLLEWRNYSKNYVSLMPENLKTEPFDILIINDEADQQEAFDFKKDLEENIKFSEHSICPKAKLLSDIYPPSGEDALDFAFELTTFIFLFITENFCCNQEVLFQSHAVLRAAIKDKTKRWSVVRVHTQPARQMSYKIPLLLENLKALKYSTTDEFYKQSICNLLDSKFSNRMQKVIALKKKRKLFFLQNYVNLKQLLQSIKQPYHKAIEQNPPEATQTSIKSINRIRDENRIHLKHSSLNENSDKQSLCPQNTLVKIKSPQNFPPEIQADDVSINPLDFPDLENSDSKNNLPLTAERLQNIDTQDASGFNSMKQTSAFSKSHSDVQFHPEPAGNNILDSGDQSNQNDPKFPFTASSTIIHQHHHHHHHHSHQHLYNPTYSADNINIAQANYVAVGGGITVHNHTSDDDDDSSEEDEVSSSSSSS